MLEKVILTASVVATISIGIFVITRDPRRYLNQIYAMLTSAMVILLIANSFTGPDESNPLLFIRIVLVATTTVITLTYLLVKALDGKAETKKSKYFTKALLAITAAVAVLDVTPAVFKEVSTSAGNLTPTPSWGAVIFFLHFVSLLAASIVLLIVRIGSADKKQRGQYISMILAIAPVMVFAPVTSFILPVVFGNSALTVITPIYIVYFVGMVAYSMVKNGLFDIKLVAVRSSAYVVSLAVLGGIYYIAAYGLSVFLFSEHTTTSMSLSPVNIVLALVLAFVFQPIKQFFDRITDRIFYRDRFDAQEFIALLSNTLSSTTDLTDMLERASEIIQMTFRCKRAFFVLKQIDDATIVAGTDRQKGFTDAEILRLDPLAIKNKGKLIVANDISSNKMAYAVLVRNGVEMLLPLWYDDKIIGYLSIGEALGSKYNSQDYKTMEAIADELVIAIQNALSLQEVQKVNANLQDRIDGATRSLRSKNEKLRKLDGTKDEFLSMASHQLRTPLTSVKGYVSMILDGDAGPINEQQRKFLTEAFASSNRMAGIIGDFLNVSRLQTGKFSIEREPIDLGELVDSEVDHLANVAGVRGLRLHFKRPAHFPIMNLDRSKIEQVVMNFIDNAIFYAPDTGEIEVELFQRSGRAVFTVRDHGIGVPKAEQAELFSKFFRATNARRKRPDGTGVGLFLAKKVVVAHKGTIIFESEEGKGSTFGFEIPLKAEYEHTR